MSYEAILNSDDVRLEVTGEGEAISVSAYFVASAGREDKPIAEWIGAEAVTRYMGDALIWHASMTDGNDEALRSAALEHAKVHSPERLSQFISGIEAAFAEASAGLASAYAELERNEPVALEESLEIPEDEEDRQERLFRMTVRQAMNRQDAFRNISEPRLDDIEEHLVDCLEYGIDTGPAREM